MLNTLLPLIVVAAALRPVVVEDAGGASHAFAQYVAGVHHDPAWSRESIEIDASLPHLKKQGRLRAIRRLNEGGGADYQVLEAEGDRMVRHQVIERYLTAQMTATEIPASSVAVTPANYEFRYKGVVQTGDGLAYAFEIKPRRKRTGLIAGELWLDGRTGTAIRLSGRLVKSPSLFVKRVDITRETVVSDGVVRMLSTHLSVHTRLAGLADLTVTEMPLEVLDANLDQ